MNWLVDLWKGDTPAHTLLVLCLVSLIGLAIGNIRIKGIGLGIAGVLFAGLGFGHFGISINHEVLEFLREFGLILFVYSIGTQVGPGFVSSLKKQAGTTTVRSGCCPTGNMATTTNVTSLPLPEKTNTTPPAPNALLPLLMALK